MARMVFNGNTATAPIWAGDYLSREHVVPGGARVDASQFNVRTAVAVTLTANAAQGATSLTVSALSGTVPVGSVLYFGSTGKLARVSTAAATGATTVAVDAIPAALSSGDAATYSGISTQKFIASGTAIGRTFAERDAGTPFGPAASTDDEFYLVAYDVEDASINPDVDLYRHGGIVKENFLPGYSSMSSQMKATLRANYATTKGAN